MKTSTEKLFLFLYLGVAAYALYCYNPFALFFQNDDFIHIPLSGAGVIFQRNSFRPICDLSVILDYRIWGKSAYGYHLSNLLLHLVGCLVVFLLVKRIIAKYFTDLPGSQTAYLATLLFFVYSTHSEAVLWILGRSGILGLIFSLLFLYHYINREKGIAAVLLYVLFLFLALLTYESSFILPLVCVFLFFIDGIRKDFTNLLIVFCSFSVYLFLRWLVTGELLGAYEVGQHEGILSVLVNFSKLLMRCFIPAYSQGIYFLIPFAIIAVILLVLLLKKPDVKLLSLTAVFLLSLFPYAMLGIDAHGYEGERYLYLPLFFLCLLMVIILQKSFKSAIATYAFFLFVLTMHTVSLAKSAADFRFSGRINRMIIDGVNTAANADTLYVDQLPQAQNGALIMRDGFKEAVNWLDTNKSKPTVIIRTRRSEWEPLNENYKTIYTDGLPAASALLKNARRTAVFYFSDSALFIKK